MPERAPIPARKRGRLYAGAFAIALAFWELLSLYVGHAVLLPAPHAVLLRLAALLPTAPFLSAVGFSLGRILLGFLLGFAVGCGLAVLAGRFPALEILLYPYMVTVRSVPVASFIILALIWFTASTLSVFISFLIVLPVVYAAVLGGIRSVDPKMLEMAAVFRLPFGVRLRYIWLPALRPFLLSSSATALGLAWKSGIAAEVIGLPGGSIGEVLYEAKLFLQSADLFAWTVAVVVLSLASEKLFSFLLRRLFAAGGML